MSLKTNILNPVPVYGYHQHNDLQCNTPMSSAYCRIRQQDELQTKYNKIHYPTTSTKEGFSNLNTIETNLNYAVSGISQFIKSLFIPNSVEGIVNKSECDALIKANHGSHQLPTFRSSKVSPIDSNSNNKLANELFLKQCFDSEYDSKVTPSSQPDTLIQQQ